MNCPRALRLCLVLAVFPTLVPASLAQPEDKSIRVRHVTGNVAVQLQSKGRLQGLLINESTVGMGDEIATGSNASLVLDFADHCTMWIGPDTRLTLMAPLRAGLPGPHFIQHSGVTITSIRQETPGTFELLLGGGHIKIPRGVVRIALWPQPPRGIPVIEIGVSEGSANYHRGVLRSDNLTLTSGQEYSSAAQKIKPPESILDLPMTSRALNPKAATEMGTAIELFAR